MDVERMQRAMEIFDEVCDLEPEQRTDIIGERCRDDDSLRAVVEQLITHDQVEGPDSPLTRGGGIGLLATNVAEQDGTVPERIGRYRIMRVIGQGGMGVVYQAEQDEPQREVALKVLRHGLATPDLLRRFRYEAKALGVLDHSGIAHIYEAGTTDIGGNRRPFFAMELIDGDPLDVHVRNDRLDTRQTLELMARVCDAVQHAHLKGIVHRDLKPANILVKRSTTSAEGTHSRSRTHADAIGQPKILDFGIARVTADDAEAVTIQTQAGQILGTVAYMSPEQVEGNVDIDARCDIYALGVILYEVLTGRRPHEFSDRSMIEAARIIKDVAPPSPGSIDFSLRGDIETIVAKAMEKDRERRYASAAALAEDIRRHLADEPIAARPASTWYQLSKFTKRNRALVSGVAVAMLALTIGFATAAVGLASARTEAKKRDIALEEEKTSRQVSEAVTDFFAGILATANPEQLGRLATVRQVMDLAANDVAGRFDERPMVEAHIRQTIGQTYNALGEYDRAAEQLEASLRIMEQELDPDDLDLPVILTNLARSYYQQGNLAQATVVHEKVLAAIRIEADPDPLDLLAGLNNVAFMAMQSSQFELAEERFLEAITLQQQLNGPDQPEVLQLRGNLALLYSYMGQFKDSEAIYLDILEHGRRTVGPEHPMTMLFASNLAALYKNNGRLDDARPLLQQTLASQEQVLGPEHSKTLITLNNLGDNLRRQGYLEEAESLLLEGLNRSRAAYGPEGPSTLFLRHTLAKAIAANERYDEAEAMMIESLDLHQRVLGETGLGTSFAYRELILLLLDRSKFERAEALAREYVEISTSIGGAHDRVFHGRRFLARALIGLEQFEEAETLLLELHESAEGESSPALARLLVGLYEAWQREDDAARWRAP